MNRREHVQKLQALEPVILDALRQLDEPVSIAALRDRLEKRGADLPLELVRSAIMRLWDADKLKVSADRQIEAAP